MNAIQVLKDGELGLKVGWLSKRVWAELDYEKSRVVFNFQLYLVSCLVHELVHWEHPDWSEARVVRSERWRVKRMTARQIKRLARRILYELSRKESGP